MELASLSAGTNTAMMLKDIDMSRYLRATAKSKVGPERTSTKAEENTSPDSTSAQKLTLQIMKRIS